MNKLNVRNVLLFFAVAGLTAPLLARSDVVIRDLGTLGGTWSYAIAINESGQVIGNSQTASGADHAFSWTAAGGMVDLGTLGGTSSQPHDINESGQVIGFAQTASGADHAFSWTAAGGMVDLGTLGGTNSYASHINESGQVVGASFTASGEFHAFLWTSAGGMVDLGTLGGRQVIVYAINESGQVIGNSQTASGADHAFSWTAAGGMVDLGTLGGTASFVFAMNESGQVVGQSTIGTGSGQSHAFSWTAAGGMVGLGTPDGAESYAYLINESGQVIGRLTHPGGPSGPFSWTAAGGMVVLGTLGGISSYARGINESGQVIGWVLTASGADHAFSWTAAGGMVDLGTLGGTSSRPHDINESGQVIGFAQTASGADHAFSWTAAGGMVDLGTLGGTYSYAEAINESGLVVGESTLAGDDDLHAVIWNIFDGDKVVPSLPEFYIIERDAGTLYLRVLDQDGIPTYMVDSWGEYIVGNNSAGVDVVAFGVSNNATQNTYTHDGQGFQRSLIDPALNMFIHPWFDRHIVDASSWNTISVSQETLDNLANFSEFFSPSDNVNLWVNDPGTSPIRSGFEWSHSFFILPNAFASTAFVVTQDANGNLQARNATILDSALDDSDGDGVVNYRDDCAETPPGETINAGGCTIAQLSPCNGARGKTGPWKNHGKYVSAVTHTANSFRDAGLISDADHGYITSEAARSACGHKK